MKRAPLRTAVLPALLAAALALGPLISCGGGGGAKNEGPGGPSDTCVRVACPRGGWVDACATAAGCGYYALSDGTRFDCAGCAAAGSIDCLDAAQAAAERCQSRL